MVELVIKNETSFDLYLLLEAYEEVKFITLPREIAEELIKFAKENNVPIKYHTTFLLPETILLFLVSDYTAVIAIKRSSKPEAKQVKSFLQKFVEYAKENNIDVYPLDKYVYNYL